MSRKPHLTAENELQRLERAKWLRQNITTVRRSIFLDESYFIKYNQRKDTNGYFWMDPDAPQEKLEKNKGKYVSKSVLKKIKQNEKSITEERLRSTTTACPSSEASAASLTCLSGRSRT